MKFQFFQNFTKKKIEIIKMFLHFWFFTCLQLFSFRTSLFIKRSHVSLHSYSMFKHVNFGKHIWMHTSKTLKKKHTHFKILSRDEVFTCLYFFFSSRDEISSAVFLTGMSSSCDEISKKHTHFKILSWDEVFTRLYFFFSSPDEISSAVFWQGWVHPATKFHLGKNV